MYCPEKLDPEKFNWKLYSLAVAQYCPENFDPERYNWKDSSREVAKCCPEKLDPEKYNWELNSWDFCRMKSENVKSFIDRKIYQQMVDGATIQSIQSELVIKCKNITNTFLLDKGKNTKYTIDDILKMSFSELDNIVGETRLRYIGYYIKHSKKRIDDLEWLSSNKYKFKQYSNSQVFNLIKLKEKLSNPLYL